MSDQWYYAIGGESRGPVSKRELKERAQSGEVTSATLVWREGLDDWTAAGTLGLNDGPPPIKPPLPPSVPPKTQAISMAATPPPPPARYTAPPPRPTSRAVSAGGQQTTIAVSVGVALLAGLAIGWLAHAMLMPPQEKVVAAVTPPAARPTARPVMPKPETPSSLPATSTIALPTSVPPAAVVPSPLPAPKSSSVPPSVSPPAEAPVTTPPAIPETPTASGSSASTPPPASPPAAATSPPSSSQPSQGSQYVPKLTLYQEIDVQRASKMPILNVVSETRYQILSELKVGDPDSDGVRTVGQTVLETRLAKADPLSQANYDEALKKLKGWQFSYTLAKDGEVLKMAAGPADAPMVAKVEPMGNKGFLVTSVMDEAGWKELAQMSFYVPDVQASGNKRQVRQMSHDLGPLGSFTGETTFVRKGTQQGLLRIDYGHKLTYRPPAAAAAIGGSELTVSGADLRPDVAGGSIWYDQKAKRVRQAEDHFHVKGEIATNLTALPVEEQQMMTVKLTDTNPWSK